MRTRSDLIFICLMVVAVAATTFVASTRLNQPQAEELRDIRQIQNSGPAAPKLLER
ncbi:MAG: hypothetical protein AAGE76_05720 [Pseudomonadota bacterium]